MRASITSVQPLPGLLQTAAQAYRSCGLSFSGQSPTYHLAFQEFQVHNLRSVLLHCWFCSFLASGVLCALLRIIIALTLVL